MAHSLHMHTQRNNGCPSLRFEKQIKTAITKCYSTVSPHLVFFSKKILLSIHLPTTQNSLVVYNTHAGVKQPKDPIHHMTLQ